MKKGKILIELDKNIHLQLKIMAAKQNISLTRLCIDYFERGLGADEDDKKQEIDTNVHSYLVMKTRDVFENQGLLAIIKFNTGSNLLVLIFSHEVLMPGDVNQFRVFDCAALGMYFPLCEYPPSILWIQIAKAGEILWLKNTDIGDEVTRKFESWKSYSS